MSTSRKNGRGPGNHLRIGPLSDSPPTAVPEYGGAVQEGAAWEALRAVIEDISGELLLRPLLTRIVIHACSLIGADNGTIGLYDAARDLIRTEAAYRMPERELGAEMPRGVGLAGEVLRTASPVLLQQYSDVPDPTLPELARNAVVGVPIVWNGEVIGVFGIGGSPETKNRFDGADIELLTLFARHAAIAIVNAQRYEREQQARRETQLLFETSERMSRAATIEEVVTAYLEQVASGGQFACTVTEYQDFQADGDPRWVRILGRWMPKTGLDLREARIPFVRDALDDELEQGRTVPIPNVHKDPRVNETLKEIQRQAGRPALALIPLRGQATRRLGHVILSAPRVHEWTTDELRRFQITAAQLATALDSRRQQEIGAERQRQLAALEERRRLARDLHDAVTQTLFSLHLIAQSVPPVLGKNPTEAARRTDRIVELSHAALTEMRALLAELKPTEAEDAEEAPDATRATLTRLRRDGLVATLAAFVAQTNDAQAALPGKRPRVLLEQEGELPRLSGETAETLLRIAQEAVANAVKHARASRIAILLAAAGGDVRLTVQDNGQGFAPRTKTGTSRSDGSGLGLGTMRERAEAVGATFALESTPGKGTRVQVVVR